MAAQLADAAERVAPWVDDQACSARASATDGAVSDFIFVDMDMLMLTGSCNELECHKAATVPLSTRAQ